MLHPDSFRARATLEVGGRAYTYFRLGALESIPGARLDRLPFSLKVLLENVVRNEDGAAFRREDVEALATWNPKQPSRGEIAFRVARVLLQDFTGVPAVVDLAALRDAIERLGGDPARINPLQPVDLVIDHSVQVDLFGSRDAFARNAELELTRNRERYVLLRWAQKAFKSFRVVPPDTGIVHQVNLEYLAQVVSVEERGAERILLPDTLVGTDSHTTMVNGLGVLGWGVGGIEAEAAMLGQPQSLVVPDVVGVRLSGALGAGATATDLVLTITERLRQKGVVGKFVEFFGPGLPSLPLADRATLANMAPEYGATCGMFPVDARTIEYLALTGRPAAHVELVEAYCRAQGLWREDGAPDPDFSDVVDLDLASVEPSLAGPKRPQDRIPLARAKAAFREAMAAPRSKDAPAPLAGRAGPVEGGLDLKDGAVVIAAITSCTNTSNPAVMLAAGLLAKKAVAAGLNTKPWVKTSLAPGSQVVVDYLSGAGAMEPLEALGFHVVAFGCTTCIGNSGPLPEAVSRAIESTGIAAAAVLSGNRNFEGRIHPLTRLNYLASPPLVVAYALAGTMEIDFASEPLGQGLHGPVFLKDVWPSPNEVAAAVRGSVKGEMFRARYADVFAGDERWRALAAPEGDRYPWSAGSTYLASPPFLSGHTREPRPLAPIAGARVLLKLGDSVTTDHISPAGSIKSTSPAGRWLTDRGVKQEEFNSYGARRGHHEVMVRGTFANIRIRNELVEGVEGGVTALSPGGEPLPVYDAAMRYRDEGVPLVVLAGKEYGTGSSRDWAAKGTFLLGVRAVIAESFERIHKSNLVGMGVLPLQFMPGETRLSLALTGFERFDVEGVERGVAPRQVLDVRAVDGQGREKRFSAVARIDTPEEAACFRHGGVLPYVLRQLVERPAVERPA